MKIYNIDSININGRKEYLKFDKDLVNLHINSRSVKKFYERRSNTPIEIINMEFIDNELITLIPTNRRLNELTELKDEIIIHPISNYKKDRLDIRIKFEIIDLNITEKEVDGFKLIFKDEDLIGYYDINNRYISKYNFGSYDESEVIERLKADRGQKNFESTIRDEFIKFFDELNNKLIARCGVKVGVTNVSILNKDNGALLGIFKY